MDNSDYLSNTPLSYSRADFRTSQRKEKMARVLCARQDNLTLILANIHDPHNVSAIYRSCDAFGVSSVRLYYTTTVFPHLGSKTSASARKWVDSVRCANIAELQKSCDGFQILATSFSADAKSLWNWDFLQPTAVILGNEHAGVDEELLKMADGKLYIPMFGMVQSFNVSVAAAIILAEAARQRKAAGWYNQCNIPALEFEERLAKWLEK